MAIPTQESSGSLQVLGVDGVSLFILNSLPFPPET